MAKDHFVPRHYLRRFTIGGSEEIMATQISPYRFLGKKGLGAVCREVGFYEGDEALNKLIWTSENDFAPVLLRVVENENFNEPELVALRWLAVTLYLRTSKAAEAYKIFPKRICYEFVKHGIENGELPPPGGEWTEEMVDCEGVPGFLIKTVGIPCALEMQTLACKLLKAPDEASFITSDNPVHVLNQFCAKVEPLRNFAGFSKAGFQLSLPISPKLCLFFYDAKVYKVGFRRNRVVQLSADDVEIVNALQIQSADESVYFNEAKLENKVQGLISRYAGLRVPVEDHLQTFAGAKEGDQLIHFRQLSVRLPRTWGFCGMRRHINSRVGDRRDPGWTALIEELMADIDKNPQGGDIDARLNKILADPTTLKNIRSR